MSIVRLLSLCVVFGVIWYYYGRRHAGVPVDVDVTALLAFESISPEHVERSLDAARRFEEERLGHADIHAMSEHMHVMLGHMNELLLRMPNDPPRAAQLRKLIEDTEYKMQDTLQRVRRDTNRLYAFPHQFGTYFYKDFVGDEAPILKPS